MLELKECFQYAYCINNCINCISNIWNMILLILIITDGSHTLGNNSLCNYSVLITQSVNVFVCVTDIYLNQTFPLKPPQHPLYQLYFSRDSDRQRCHGFVRRCWMYPSATIRAVAVRVLRSRGLSRIPGPERAQRGASAPGQNAGAHA